MPTRAHSAEQRSSLHRNPKGLLTASLSHMRLADLLLLLLLLPPFLPALHIIPEILSGDRLQGLLG